MTMMAAYTNVLNDKIDIFLLGRVGLCTYKKNTLCCVKCPTGTMTFLVIKNFYYTGEMKGEYMYLNLLNRWYPYLENTIPT